MKDPQEVQGIALHPGLAFAGDRAGLGMHGLNAGVDLGKGWTWVNRKCGVESLDGFSVCVCVCVCVCPVFTLCSRSTSPTHQEYVCCGG